MRRILFLLGFCALAGACTNVSGGNATLNLSLNDCLFFNETNTTVYAPTFNPVNLNLTANSSFSGEAGNISCRYADLTNLCPPTFVSLSAPDNFLANNVNISCRAGAAAVNATANCTPMNLDLRANSTFNGTIGNITCGYNDTSVPTCGAGRCDFALDYVPTLGTYTYTDGGKNLSIRIESADTGICRENRMQVFNESGTFYSELCNDTAVFNETCPEARECPTGDFILAPAENRTFENLSVSCKNQTVVLDSGNISYYTAKVSEYENRIYNANFSDINNIGLAWRVQNYSLAETAWENGAKNNDGIYQALGVAGLILGVGFLYRKGSIPTLGSMTRPMEQEKMQRMKEEFDRIANG